MTLSVSVGRTHPDHVVHGVDVRVAHVDPDGSQREAVFLTSPLDDDGRPGCGSGGKVAAGGGVSGGRVGREGARRHGAGEGGGGVVV